ncbi:MAG: cytochrome C [Phycisphaerae bacterium]
MVALAVKSLVGPRVPAAEFARAWPRYLTPLILFTVAGILLLASISRPYWRMTLHAPQYPKGLTTRAYLTHLTGDVQEINELNHYIGMLPLEQGGQMERANAPALLVGFFLLLVAAAFVHTRWAVLLTLPAILYPLLFLLDLQCWLYYFGHHLDPHAALSHSIKPFTPRVLGIGFVGQFKTVAVAEQGFWFAAAAAAVVFVGLFFHRMAYKPLLAKRRAAGKARS